MTNANERSAATRPQVETVRTRRPARRSVAALGSLFRIPLYRSATALVLTTGANAALGLVFWALAARLYTVEDLGRGAATVAALQLVSMLGCSGLTPALIRFIPPSRLSTRRLVEVTYLAGVSLALLCGAGVVIASYLFIEPLSVPGVVFLGGVAAFIHDESTPSSVLLKAALAHVQFETIHPFPAGNGRVGRPLIALPS